jgi:hypothetical protein
MRDMHEWFACAPRESVIRKGPNWRALRLPEIESTLVHQPANARGIIVIGASHPTNPEIPD